MAEPLDIRPVESHSSPLRKFLEAIDAYTNIITTGGSIVLIVGFVLWLVSALPTLSIFLMAFSLGALLVCLVGRLSVSHNEPIVSLGKLTSEDDHVRLHVAPKSAASSGTSSAEVAVLSSLLQPRAQQITIKHSACGIEETLVHSGTMAVADVYERTYGDKEDFVCAGVAYVKLYRDDNAGGTSVNVFAQIEFLDPVDLVNPLFVVDKGYWFKVSKPHWDRAHFQIGDPEQLIIAIIRPDNLVLPYSGHNVFGGDEWEFAFNGKGFTAKELLIRVKLIARTWGGEAAYRGTFEYVLTTGDVPKMIPRA